MAKRGNQPRIKAAKTARGAGQPKIKSVGAHARKIASQPSLGGNRKRK